MMLRMFRTKINWSDRVESSQNPPIGATRNFSLATRASLHLASERRTRTSNTSVNKMILGSTSIQPCLILTTGYQSTPPTSYLKHKPSCLVQQRETARRNGDKIAVNSVLNLSKIMHTIKILQLNVWH